MMRSWYILSPLCAYNFRKYPLNLYFQFAKFVSETHARTLEDCLLSEEGRKIFSDALSRYLIQNFDFGEMRR